MNFKKTNILLVIMSFVLLVSIGSVCAEDATADADVQTATDGPNVVLSDGGNDKGTIQEKVNTTVTTDNNAYKYGYEDDKNITVTVKDNDSQEINDLNDTNFAAYDNKTPEKKLNFVYNKTSGIITLLDKLDVGNHTIILNYLGNDTHNGNSTSFLLKIFGNNTIKTENTIISDGTTIEIPVKVFDGVDYIDLVKENFSLNLTYINETGNITSEIINVYDVDDGKIRFSVAIKLINASLTINYTNAVELKTVKIKISTGITAESDKDKFNADENKTITFELKDSSGNIISNLNTIDFIILDNGNEIKNFKVNGSKIIITTDALGMHNLTITYKGNETYNASNTTVELKVYGNNRINAPEYIVSDGITVEIPITVFDGIDNLTDKKFTLNLTYTNRTGDVTSIIIDTYEFTDGKLSFSVAGYKWSIASLNINYINSTGSKDVKIYLNSSIEATPAKNKYRFNETNNITIIVKDNEGNTLNISKNDLEIYDNGKKITEYTYNTTTSILTVKLDIGVHNLIIKYLGNNTFYSSNTAVEQKVSGDYVIDPSKSATLDENKDITITLNLSDGADLQEIDLTKLNMTLFYTIDGVTYNRTITPTSNGQNLTFNFNDENFTSAYVDIKYAAENNLTGRTIIKVNTDIISSDLQIGDSQVKNITVTVTGDNAHIINITKDNIQIINNNNGKTVSFTVNGSVITLTDASLTIGKYNLTIKYIGDDTFIESLKNITLTVYGINTTSSVSVNSTKIVEVKVNITDGKNPIEFEKGDFTLKVDYKNGTVIDITEFELHNGTISFTLENSNFTTATLVINYKNNESVKNVTLNRIYNFKAIVIINETYYQYGNFTFQIVDADTGQPLAKKTFTITAVSSSNSTIFWDLVNNNGSFSLNTEKSFTTDSEGMLVINNKNFYPGIAYTPYTIFAPVGEYNITIIPSGNIKGNEKVTVKIKQVQTSLEIVKFNEYYGTSEKITIVVTNSETGTPLNSITVEFKLTTSSGNEIPFTTTDGSKINTTTTNNEGIIELPASNLNPGTYSIVAYAKNSTNNNASTGSNTAKINKIPITISTKDVTVLYNTGTTTTIKIIDKRTNKPIANAYVALKIDSTQMGGFTDKNGLISVAASLKVGKHKLTVTDVYNVYTSDGKTYLRNIYDYSQVTKTITVKKASAKITAKKVTDYYKGVKSFTVKLTNTKNEKAIYDAKINIKIYISSNRYYNYNGNTGSNGQLKLLLNTLKPGTYKVVVSGADSKDFSAKQVTSKIVIKKAPTKLTPKKLTAKKGAKKYFKVTVTNKKTKKVISGVKIKIKVYTGKKAKTYTVKTNSKGIAQINTKSLKVGKHKVVVTSANKYCVAKTAKSTIKIKK